MVYIYDIYMCDTKRIVQTMNVIFHQTPGLPETTIPDELFFDLTTRKPVELLDGCPICATDDVVEDQQVGLPDVSHNIPPPTFDDTISVHVPQCKYPLNARLALGNLSRITSIHGRARVQALAGLTVNDALTMSYFFGGKYKRYKCKDLNYDVNNGSLIVLDECVTFLVRLLV